MAASSNVFAAPENRGFWDRLYFTDPALAAWLLDIETPAQIERDPLAGGLFENLVVVEALKARLHAGRSPKLYFFRDSNGREVDLLYPGKQGLIPIEIKSAMTYTPEFLSGIRYFQKLSGNQLPGRVIYAGKLEFRSEEAQVLHFTNAFDSND